MIITCMSHPSCNSRWTPMSQSPVGSTVKSTQRAQSARPSPSGPLQPTGPTGSTSPGIKAGGGGGRRPVSSSPLKGSTTTPVRGLPPGVGPHPWQQQPGVGKLAAGGGVSSPQSPGGAAAADPAAGPAAAVSTLTTTRAHVNDGPRGAALHLQNMTKEIESLRDQVAQQELQL